MSCDIEKETIRELDALAALAVTANSTAESFSHIRQIWDGKRDIRDIALQAQRKRKPRTKPKARRKKK